MSDNEPDVQDFLQRIVWSISAGLGWLFLNMTLGIFAGFMFFYNKPRLGNVIFYVWMICSLAVLLWFLHRMWKKKFPHG